MQNELRILILEDDEDDAAMVERALEKGRILFTSIRVDTRTEFEGALDTFQPDVILSDHSMHQFDSIEALRICHERKIAIPFLLVTGAVSDQFAVACMKLGADDYLLKSNLEELPGAIRHAIRRRRQVLNRRQQYYALRDQNKKLKKLNRDLDLFVYGASHNLRAPLRSVLGLINISRCQLNENNVNALLQYFNLMEENISELDETLKLILEYSRSSRFDVEAEEIDFDKLITGIFEGLNYINGPEAVRKFTTVHAGPAFHCNKLGLNLILLNLASNAIKYYDPSKEKPFIKVEVFPAADHVTIVFEDNGIGILQELQHRVFEMFYRATEKAEGTGLGLYIVNETLNKLGGTVTLVSTYGIGTTFTIVIPRATSVDSDTTDLLSDGIA